MTPIRNEPLSDIDIETLSIIDSVLYRYNMQAIVYGIKFGKTYGSPFFVITTKKSNFLDHYKKIKDFIEA